MKDNLVGVTFKIEYEEKLEKLLKKLIMVKLILVRQSLMWTL